MKEVPDRPEINEININEKINKPKNGSWKGLIDKPLTRLLRGEKRDK